MLDSVMLCKLLALKRYSHVDGLRWRLWLIGGTVWLAVRLLPVALGLLIGLLRLLRVVSALAWGSSCRW